MINIDELLRKPGALTNGRTYREVLYAARVRITDHTRWTQRAFARDSRGVYTLPTSSISCKWCLLGAVARESNPNGLIDPQLLRYMEDMRRHLHPDRFVSLGNMNDYLDHEGVLDFLDSCIRNIPAH